MEKPEPAVSRKKHATRLAGTLLTLFCFMGNGAMAEESREYSVKAAVMLNFARFTLWPSEGPVPSENIELCILGKRRLAPAFREIDGKEVNGRNLRVRFAQGVSDMGSCDMLFLTSGFNRMEAGDIFAMLVDRPVLTIGENPEFIFSGGMINLFHENDRIRFEVNPGTINKHGLTISSRLLRLAIIAGDHSTGQPQ